MITNQPAQVFPPGEFVREELEARGWTQADLASVIGRPVQLVNLIVTAKKAITPRTAGELAAAFGTSPELWLNLQSAYALSQTPFGVNPLSSKEVPSLQKRHVPGSTTVAVILYGLFRNVSILRFVQPGSAGCGIRGPRRALRLRQRLLQIGDQVGRVLDPRRKPNQPRWNAGLPQLCIAQQRV